MLTRGKYRQRIGLSQGCLGGVAGALAAFVLRSGKVLSTAHLEAVSKEADIELLKQHLHEQAMMCHVSFLLCTP